jgi:MFS family permease
MSDSSDGAGLWRNRNWRLLWTGQAVSVTGDMVFYMTVLLWIATIIAKGYRWAPAAASGALVATAAPVLIVGPLAGVFVDRWNRRRTMLTADMARFLLIMSLLVLPALRHQIPVGFQLGFLYVVLAISSCFAEFFDPSRLAVLGSIVPPSDRPKASGHLSAAFSLAQVLGPPIAAPLLITFGVQWALIVNAASFLFSFACIRAIRVPQADEPLDKPERASFRKEFSAGIKFFVGSRILMTLAIGVVIAMLGNGAVNSLCVFFIPQNLHVKASWLGTLIGAVGLGAVAGSLLAGYIARRIPPTKLFWMSLILCGVTLVAFARMTALAPAIGVAVLIGIGSGILNAVISPILLSAAPSHMLGRVSAVLSPLIQLASIVSMVLAGVLASTVLHGFHATVAGVSFGQYDTVLAAGGLLFVLGGLAAILPLRGAEPVQAGDTAAPGGSDEAAADPAAAT